VTAAALVVTAAVVVIGAVFSASLTPVSVAALLAVLLGAAATRITYSELLTARREAGADRVRQAQAYREIAEARSAEHQEFASAMQHRVGTAERAMAQLETAFVASQGRAADAMRKLNREAARADHAEAESGRLTVALEESEERAAEAIVRVAELEQDNDVLRAELDTASSWHPPQARHA
jgi:chromosome segregation ATPase